MSINKKPLAHLVLIAVACSLSTACVTLSSFRGKKETENTETKIESKEPPVKTCNIEELQKKEMSDGSTKAKLSQSCNETIVYIQNNHQQYPKRCRILVGTQLTEIYLKPGESRSLTQTGQVDINAVQLGCVNDWKRSGKP